MYRRRRVTDGEAELEQLLEQVDRTVFGAARRVRAPYGVAGEALYEAELEAPSLQNLQEIENWIATARSNIKKSIQGVSGSRMLAGSQINQAIRRIDVLLPKWNITITNPAARRAEEGRRTQLANVYSSLVAAQNYLTKNQSTEAQFWLELAAIQIVKSY